MPAQGPAAGAGRGAEPDPDDHRRGEGGRPGAARADGQAQRLRGACPRRHRLRRRPRLRGLARTTTSRRSTPPARTPRSGALQGILAYTEDPIVSTDIIERPHSSIFDTGSDDVIDGTLLKAWPGTTTSGATRTAAWSWPPRCSSRRPWGLERRRAARGHVREGERPRRRGRGHARSCSAPTSTCPSTRRDHRRRADPRRAADDRAAARAGRQSCSSRTWAAPRGPDPALSMAPVAARLESCSAPVGAGAGGRRRRGRRRGGARSAGEVLMLENSRFERARPQRPRLAERLRRSRTSSSTTPSAPPTARTPEPGVAHSYPAYAACCSSARSASSPPSRRSERPLSWSWAAPRSPTRSALLGVRRAGPTGS